MKIVGIDPGPTVSAFVTINEDLTILHHATYDNESTPEHIESATYVIEWMVSFGNFSGKPIRREPIYNTLRWIGRFEERIRRTGNEVVFITRRDVKQHLIPKRKAWPGKSDDAKVRAALIARYGGKKAIGTIRKPGPLYGVTEHEWAALAVALTFADKLERS